MPPRTTSSMDVTATLTTDKRVHPDSDGLPRRSSSIATASYVQAPPQQRAQRSPPPPGPQQQHEQLRQRHHHQSYHQHYYQHQHQQHQHQQHDQQLYQQYHQLQPQQYQRRQDPAEQQQQQLILRAAALSQPPSYQSQVVLTPQQWPLSHQHSLPRSQQQRLQLEVQQDEQALDDLVQQMVGVAGGGVAGYRGGGGSSNSAGAICDEYGGGEGGGGGRGLVGRDAAQLTGPPTSAPLPTWEREDGGRPNDGVGVLGAGVGIGPALCVPVSEGAARIFAEEVERMWLETGSGRVSEQGQGPDQGQVPARSAYTRSTNSSPSLRLSPEHHEFLGHMLGLGLTAEPEGRSDAEVLFQMPGSRQGGSAKGAGSAASLAAGEQMGHRGDLGFWTQQPPGVMMMVGGQHYPHNPSDAQPGARPSSRCGEQARAEPRQAQQQQQQQQQQKQQQQQQQYGFYQVQEQQHRQHNQQQQQQGQQRQPLRNAAQPELHAALHQRPGEFDLSDGGAVSAAAGASARGGGRSDFMPVQRQHSRAARLKPATAAAAAAAAVIATVKAAESPGGSRRPTRRIRPPIGLRDFVVSEVSCFGGEVGDGERDGDGGREGAAQGGLGMKGRAVGCEGSSFSLGSSAQQGSGMSRGLGGERGGQAKVGVNLGVAAHSALPHVRLGAGAAAGAGAVAGARAGPSRKKGVDRPKGARRATDAQAATTSGAAKRGRSVDTTAVAAAAASPARWPRAQLRPAGARGYAAEEEAGAPSCAVGAADGQAPNRRQRYRLLSELVVALPEVKLGEHAGAGAAVGYGEQGGVQGLCAGRREAAGGAAAVAAAGHGGGAGVSSPLNGRGGDCAAASQPFATAAVCGSRAPRILSARYCGGPLPSVPEVALLAVGSSAGLGHSELVVTGGEACVATSAAAAAGLAPPLVDARTAVAMPRRLALPSGSELVTQLTTGVAAAYQATAVAAQRSKLAPEPGPFSCGGLGQEAGRRWRTPAADALGPAVGVCSDPTASTVLQQGLSPTADDSAVHQPVARCFEDGYGDGYDDDYADAFLDGPG